MKELLGLPPAAWQIREQTLIQIADAFPTMTVLEFRLSIRYLVKQAEEGKQTIQHHNAWFKAAFEKNGGPLVTETDKHWKFSIHAGLASVAMSTSTVLPDPPLQ